MRPKRYARRFILGIGIFTAVSLFSAATRAAVTHTGMFGLWGWGNMGDALQLVHSAGFELAVIGAKELDLANQYKVKGIVALGLQKDSFNDSQKWQAALSRVKTTVAQYKDHPAVFAWYPVDEPDYQQIPVAKIRELRAAIKSVDPVHPLFTTVTAPDKWYGYLPFFDIVSIDRYLQVNSLGIREKPDVVTKAIRKLKGDCSKLKIRNSVWITLGAFQETGKDSSYVSPWATPTPDEFNQMLDFSVKEGVSGILVYTLARKTANLVDWKLPVDDPPLWGAVKNVPVKAP